MKGIILAGGTGSRLFPLTTSTSKQMMPVYDKPLIYYPLATLMLAGIREILVISTANAIAGFRELLGSGDRFGLSIQYAEQPKPEGIAQSLLIGERFIGAGSVALVLGDNIFYGPGLGRQLAKCNQPNGAIILGYEVQNPSNYGVVEFNEKNEVINIVEKPAVTSSNTAIPGLYFFDNRVLEKVKSITKSKRGEYEITSVLSLYLADKALTLLELNRGTVWMDCGTFDGLNDASNFVRIIQERQQLMISCPEEIALVSGYISKQDLENSLQSSPQNNYYNYLRRLVANL